MSHTSAAHRTPAPAGSADDRDRFRSDVLAGLSARPRHLSSLWFYDDEGSRLFQRIMELPEYYLTRCEREILEREAGRIAEPLAGRPCTVVDLGAGDGVKTRLLLRRLHGSPGLAYAPVDVSAAALEQVVADTGREWPGVTVLPVAAEYAEALRRLRAREPGRTLLALLLGSNIGNLESAGALGLLREIRRALRPGDWALVGFDLVKDPEVLRRAYDDAQGVTAAFNLNLLSRMNRELGADLDLSAFAHRATFDPVRPAMESWLVSLRRQRIRVAGRTFSLRQGEPIHTEISCKYREADIRALAARAGFEERGLFLDSRGWFADALWQVGEEKVP
jgi:dimethylhistidine N-methyltransferase